MEFNSIPFNSFINSIHAFFSTFSWFFSHPLFSTIVTLYTLVLLYAPSFFLRVVLSPVLNSTAIILLFLLKFGANERSENELTCNLTCQDIGILDSNGNDRLEKESYCLGPSVLDHKDGCYDHSSKEDGYSLSFDPNFDLEPSCLEERFVDVVDHSQGNLELTTKVESNQGNVDFEHDLGPESNSKDDYDKEDCLDTSSMDSLQVVQKGEAIMELDRTIKVLEWNMKGPLEIIYEAYEGEEEDDDDDNGNDVFSSAKHVMGCEGNPSLSMCCSESETDSSSEDDFMIKEKWETQEGLFLKWESEQDEREELIEIAVDGYKKKCIEFSQDEEDNMIEIDIFT